MFTIKKVIFQQMKKKVTKWHNIKNNKLYLLESLLLIWIKYSINILIMSFTRLDLEKIICDSMLKKINN